MHSSVGFAVSPVDARLRALPAFTVVNALALAGDRELCPADVAQVVESIRVGLLAVKRAIRIAPDADFHRYAASDTYALLPCQGQGAMKKPS